MQKKTLEASIKIPIRFNEVDSMGFVWHGNYAQYLEEARENFGKKYSLNYLEILSKGYYIPLVDLSIKYRKPIIYGMEIEVKAKYIFSDAAKIIFDYEIKNINGGELLTTARTVQVFLNKMYELEIVNPEFYTRWKEQFFV